MSEFLGVFLGALVGSLAGWWLLVRENERLETRRVNNEALASLGRAMVNYLDMAIDPQEPDIDFIATQAGTVGREYVASTSGTFDEAELSALRKLETDLAEAVREIATAPDRDGKSDAYDRWTKRLNDQHFVLKRAAYDFSAPGWRSLFRRYR